jgi:UDP-GlcNAc:undecaprenyl-phosphate GlcNAc-1-phosphate transferase
VSIIFSSIIVACFSFFITFFLIPLVARMAIFIDILDKPDGILKMQSKPIPYLGGFAIWSGFMITSIIFLHTHVHEYAFFLYGSIVLLIVGLLDDIYSFKPYQKFCGQIIAAFIFLKGGLCFKEQFLLTCNTSLSIFIWKFVSFGWILSIVNAYNLVDVMDGLASSLAICSSAFLLLCAWWVHASSVALLLAIFLGAVAAFFYYNKPAASIYLGDAGSLFIGGFLATMSFMIPWGTFSVFGFCAPIAAQAIPLLEVLTLIIIRKYKKIPFYRGSPDHFSSYFQRAGWRKWMILGYCSFVAIMGNIVAFLFFINIISFSLFILIGMLYALAWYIVLFFACNRNLLLFSKKTEKATSIFKI